MRARAGCEIVQINGVPFEIPLNIRLFHSPNGEIMYITGVRKESISPHNNIFIASVKNVVRGTITEVKYGSAEERLKQAFTIKNVDGDEYHIPYSKKYDAQDLMREFDNKKKDTKAQFKRMYKQYIQVCDSDS